MTPNPLDAALARALQTRRKILIPTPDLYNEPVGSTSRGDLFSNDYLSLCSDPHLRQAFLDNVAKTPLVFGSGGSRLMSGNAPTHIDFEDRMQVFFRASAALLCNSGYDANVAFWHAVPQTTDAVIFDELVHASTRDGLLGSRTRNALYPFPHNSVSSLRGVILRVLEEHPEIAAGKATLFLAVEGLYSMDGDFAPLPEIVQLVEELIPRDCGHIFVDEAHSTGICGSQGRGLISALGLETRVSTVLHTFGKARAFTGAVLLTSPIVRQYIINYGRAFIYSTSPAHATMCALNASCDYIESPAGAELIRSLQEVTHLFERKLTAALEGVPLHLLCLSRRPNPSQFPPDIVSPIFPILTSAPRSLADFLNGLGYAARPVPYPVVPRSQERVRVVVHARNTEGQLDELIENLLKWVESVVAMENCGPPPKPLPVDRDEARVVGRISRTGKLVSARL